MLHLSGQLLYGLQLPLNLSNAIIVIPTLFVAPILIPLRILQHMVDAVEAHEYFCILLVAIFDASSRPLMGRLHIRDVGGKSSDAYRYGSEFVGAIRHGARFP